MDADALADSEGTAGPACIDQPDASIVLQNLLLQEFCINKRMVDHEWPAEEGAEGHFGLDAEADFCSGNLAGIAGDEVVDGLIGSELGDRRHHARSIAGEEDDILRMSRTLLGHAVLDVRERVGCARVFRDGVVVEIQAARDWIESDIFKDRAEPAGAAIDLWFGFG